RSQNADIRRTKNDIQPYRVAAAHDVAESHADDTDQFLRSRLSANAELLTPSQNPTVEFGSARSEIDLHGLGPQQTLVLVDGLRMPSIPTTGTAFLQPDINGIPVGMIERIETLSTSGSGIYGPGATGGVVNIILKRDYQGAALTLDTSLSQQGGGDRRRVEARLGFTPDHGATDVMIAGDYQTISELREGQRTLTERTNAIASGNSLETYVQNQATADAVIVFNPIGNLSLKPAYGGAALGTTITFLPIGSSKDISGIATQLLMNAGTVPTTLSPGANGLDRSLVSASRSWSVIGSVRHRFGPSIEGFVDLLVLDDEGRALSPNGSASGTISSLSPTSPFEQFVDVSLPAPTFGTAFATRTTTSRLTAGAIARLAGGWKADASIAIGGVRNQIDQDGSTLSIAGTLSLTSGLAGPAGQPALNPFGNWQTFLDALNAYRAPLKGYFRLDNNFSDANLRLAGPILRLPGGDLALTTLLEWRRESEPKSILRGVTEFAPNGSEYESPNVLQQAGSAYAELRAPIVSSESGLVPLRGLEVQLAVRYDRTQIDAPSFYDTTSGNAERASARYGTMNYTLGLRVFPSKLLMLRASVATGSLPPSPSQIGGIRTDLLVGPDAARGGAFYDAVLQFGGSFRLRPELARSISAGAVFNPAGTSGPRISIDYLLLEKRHEIVNLYGDFSTLIDNEAEFTDRVFRAPLTDADRAAGYTAGPLTLIDATTANSGRSRVQTVDLDLDWHIPLRRFGAIRAYGTGTWELEFIQQIAAGTPWTVRNGYSDGPLDWRGNAGIDWSYDRFSIGLNGQYYSRYHVSASGGSLGYVLVLQGSDRVAPQFYLDLDLSYRVLVGEGGGRSRALLVRAGITNIRDHLPPYLFNGPGYSFYGDPRLRRVSLSLGSSF
ncbi:MAG: TonB-dependent receptor plug domain-containing protein, partial [Janthinobacterium lividum]